MRTCPSVIGSSPASVGQTHSPPAGTSGRRECLPELVMAKSVPCVVRSASVMTLPISDLAGAPRSPCRRRRLGDRLHRRPDDSPQGGARSTSNCSSAAAIRGDADVPRAVVVGGAVDQFTALDVDDEPHPGEHHALGAVLDQASAGRTAETCTSVWSPTTTSTPSSWSVTSTTGPVGGQRVRRAPMCPMAMITSAPCSRSRAASALIGSTGSMTRYPSAPGRVSCGISGEKPRGRR